jgi:hypothetical protein
VGDDGDGAEELFLVPPRFKGITLFMTETLLLSKANTISFPLAEWFQNVAPVPKRKTRE